MRGQIPNKPGRYGEDEGHVVAYHAHKPVDVTRASSSTVKAAKAIYPSKTGSITHDSDEASPLQSDQAISPPVEKTLGVLHRTSKTAPTEDEKVFVATETTSSSSPHNLDNLDRKPAAEARADGREREHETIVPLALRMRNFRSTKKPAANTTKDPNPAENDPPIKKLGNDSQFNAVNIGSTSKPRASRLQQMEIADDDAIVKPNVHQREPAYAPVSTNAQVPKQHYLIKGKKLVAASYCGHDSRYLLSRYKYRQGKMHRIVYCCHSTRRSSLFLRMYSWR